MVLLPFILSVISFIWIWFCYNFVIPAYSSVFHFTQKLHALMIWFCLANSMRFQRFDLFWYLNNPIEFNQGKVFM